MHHERNIQGPERNDARRRRPVKFPHFVAGGIWLLLFLASPALAVDPNTRISQYAHTAYRIQNGVFSGTPSAIVQTTDGYLWIGTQTGLVRFDGVRFVPWSPPEGQAPLSSNSIISLLADPDGSLWIGTTSELAHWSKGQLYSFTNARGRINEIVRDGNGTIWITRSRVREQTGPLCEVRGPELLCHGSAEGFRFPYASSLATDGGGNFWVGSSSALTHWRAGRATVYEPPNLKSAQGLSGIQGLRTGADGTLWVGMDRSGVGLGLQQFIGGKFRSFTAPDFDGSKEEILSIFIDRAQTVWVGTENRGLLRIRGQQVDRFSSAEGLSSNTVGGFFEDREGNLWVVTAEGIDYFHDLRVLSYSTHQGLNANEVNSVAVTLDGVVWFGNAGGLERLEAGKITQVGRAQGLPGSAVTALLADRAGRLWVGVDDGLAVYQAGKFSPVKRGDGSPTRAVLSLAEDRKGDIWAEALGNPRQLLHIRGLTVLEEFDDTRIPRAFGLAPDAEDGLWLGMATGELARLRQGKLETFPLNGEAPSSVRQVAVRPDGSVLGAKITGLVGWKNGTLRTLTSKNGLPCNNIFGLVADAPDALWLYAECGVVRIDAAELDAWWNNPTAVLKARVYDVFDGARPGVPAFQPNATRGPDGRLWFANESIGQGMDPAHLEGNLLAPPVHIEAVVADRKTYQLAAGTLTLPARTRDVELDYTALSFVVPQKVKFRYRLEGHDAEWQEAGTRRQAFYTDLRPGTYRFRVIACNNDGVWNEIGATLDFTIQPAWYQTLWFRLLAALGVILAVVAIYRLRVRQIAQGIAVRYDERLAERTRLARELHDTFLQTIQGSKMVADDALDQPADATRLRRTLEQLSVWLGQAVEEGRAALNSLRASATEKNDLAAALRRASETCVVPDTMQVDFSTKGEPREMHPIVRDEIYRIGFEAIRNACTHSGADRLEISLAYNHNVVVRIKDNGTGIDPAFVADGKEGHFGLPGMRERAARIGAELTIESSATTGTEIKLVVPGGLAFHITSHLE